MTPPPAFSSTRQALGFVLLLLFLLLLPLLLQKPLLPPRAEIYSSLSWGAGSFPWLHDQIFEEKGDIDIAFMGSSRMGWGIDTSQVEERLSQALGRKAVVRSLWWNTPGCDALYYIIQDLLRRRNVHCIVLHDCTSGHDAHPRAPYFFRWAEDSEELDGVPLISKISFYTSAVLGAPRNLLGLLRTNLPAIPSPDITWQGGSTVFSNIPNPFSRLGACAVPMRIDAPFVEYTPPPTAHPAEPVIYSETTKDQFRFDGTKFFAMQSSFLRKVGDLARAHHTRLICLHMPLVDEPNPSVIEETAYWPDIFQTDVTIMGVIPSRFKDGMSDEDFRKLFFNFEHLNANGQKYFTSVILPGLLQLYENQSKH